MKGKKVRNVCVHENMNFGRDSRGNPITLLAFVPLKIKETTDLCAIVKPYGRGKKREFLVRWEHLHTCN